MGIGFPIFAAAAPAAAALKQLVENLHRMFIKILCDFNISIKYTTLVLYFSGVIPDFFNKKTKALRDAPTKSGFLHKFSEKIPQDLKMV